MGIFDKIFAGVSIAQQVINIAKAAKKSAKAKKAKKKAKKTETTGEEPK